MTPKRGRAVCHLTALLISLAASGCYIPGGGWTMRTGVDLRRHKKPSAFFELVDTRWDEYNRIAEINSLLDTTTLPAAFTPGAGPKLMEGVPVPPASDPSMAPDSNRQFPPGTGNAPSATPPDPRFPGDPAGGNPEGGEPSRLPGDADAPASTPLPRDAPTARRSSLDGSAIPNSPIDDVALDATVTPSSASAPPARRSRRPMASRLFSRPQ